MDMTHDGVPVYCLPDGAYCDADDEKRNPLDIEECPYGYDECSGDCFFYKED